MPDADPTSSAPPVRSAAGRPRSRVPGRTRLDYWLDLALMIAFVVDYSYRFTGLAWHEWIGLGFGLALLAHMTLHWDWVLRTTARLLRKLPGRERARWIIDLALLLVMTFCVASGVLISRSALPAVGLHPAAGSFWRGLHTTTADITVVLVGVHVALNWKWIVSVTRRLFRRTTRTAAAS